MKPRRKPKLFRQVAALPLRMGSEGVLEVLLLTSRETGRWVIPKGWPMSGKDDPDAAAVEAMEEAGVLGAVDKHPLGVYDYFKRRERHFDIVEVTVYRLNVERQLEEWPERRERKAQWLNLRYAAELVHEPGLAALLGSLAG